MRRKRQAAVDTRCQPEQSAWGKQQQREAAARQSSMETKYWQTSSSDSNKLIAIGPVYDQTWTHTPVHTGGGRERGLRLLSAFTKPEIHHRTHGKTGAATSSHPVGPEDLWDNRWRRWRMAAFIPAHIMMATSGTKQTVTLNNMDGTSMLLHSVSAQEAQASSVRQHIESIDLSGKG